MNEKSVKNNTGFEKDSDSDLEVSSFANHNDSLILSRGYSTKEEIIYGCSSCEFLTEKEENISKHRCSQ